MAQSSRGVLVLVVSLSCCTAPPIVAVPKPSSETSCGTDETVALMARGRLIAALNRSRLERAQPSSPSPACPTNSELEQKIYLDLGDCERAYAAGLDRNARCTANTEHPSELLAEAHSARATGSETLAARLTSRYLHSQISSGTAVRAVTAWLSDAKVRAFAKPDRFLVSHSQGISYVDGNSMREVHRCVERIPDESLISSRGSFITNEQGHAFDIEACASMEDVGSILAFSEDETLALASTEQQVALWGLHARKWLWSAELSENNLRRSPVAGAISTHASRAVIQWDTGDGLLVSADSGEVHELRFTDKVSTDRDAVERFLGAVGFGRSKLAPRFTSDGAQVCLSFQLEWGLGDQCWDAVRGTRIDESLEDSDSPPMTDQDLRAARQTIEMLRPFGIVREEPYLDATDPYRVERHGNDVCIGDRSSKVPQRCVPAARNARAAATRQPGGLLVAERNRLTRYGANGEPSHVMLPFRVGAYGLHSSYEDRWFSGPHPILLWDAAHDAGLLTTKDAPRDERAVRLFSDGLCLGNLCTNGTSSFLARGLPMTSGGPVPAVVTERVAADEWGAVDLSTGERIEWKRDKRSEDNVVAVALSRDGSRAWLLSENRALHSHSTTSGKLTDAIDVPRCGTNPRLANGRKPPRIKTCWSLGRASNSVARASWLRRSVTSEPYLSASAPSLDFRVMASGSSLAKRKAVASATWALVAFHTQFLPTGASSHFRTMVKTR